MNFSKTGKVFMVLAIVAVFAIAATSFAGWGRGYGGGGYHMGPGYGMHGGWGQGPRGYGGQGYQSNLSDEDIVKLDKERQAFFEATSDLRENLYQKELELRSELAKPEPDANTEVTATDHAGEWVAECMAAVAVTDPAAAGINRIPQFNRQSNQKGAKCPLFFFLQSNHAKNMAFT